MLRLSVLAAPILAEPWREVSPIEALLEDLREQAAPALKDGIEGRCEREIQKQRQAEYWQHNPDQADYRNGCRTRGLQMRLGHSGLDLAARQVHPASAQLAVIHGRTSPMNRLEIRAMSRPRKK